MPKTKTDDLIFIRKSDLMKWYRHKNLDDFLLYCLYCPTYDLKAIFEGMKHKLSPNYGVGARALWDRLCKSIQNTLIDDFLKKLEKLGGKE